MTSVTNVSYLCPVTSVPEPIVCPGEDDSASAGFRVACLHQRCCSSLENRAAHYEVDGTQSLGVSELRKQHELLVMALKLKHGFSGDT